MKTSEKPNPNHAILIEITENSALQRVDNFLVKLCKGVPKAHVFRIIRSGEVRVNSRRVDASYKLSIGDFVRIPPIKTIEKQLDKPSFSSEKLEKTWRHRLADLQVIYEDEHLLVVNKPAGLAVHGGSGESWGLIELLRQARGPGPQAQALELVHRIDRETSGVLIIAKKRSALRALQEQLRERSWKKFYITLVKGTWPVALKKVDLPLTKIQAQSHEKRVLVDPNGDKSVSLFEIKQLVKSGNLSFSLLQVRILTGRTHQIRVHTSASGYPIVGDDRYGDFALNRTLAKQGLKRMFLHAARIQLTHPATGQLIEFDAPLASELQRYLDMFEVQKNKKGL